MRWTASKLSRWCAHHHLLADINPRPTRDKAAAKGKKFDAALEHWHSTGAVLHTDDDDVNEWLRCMLWHNWAWPDGIELQRAWGLSTFGTHVAVEEKPEGSHIYVPLDGEDMLTAGRADAIWPGGEELIVSCDWKSGKTMVAPARANLQVNAAGMAACDRWKARGFVPTIYYARSGVWDVGDPVEKDSPEWRAMLEVIREAALLDDQPHPGDHCNGCWERKNCSAA